MISAGNSLAKNVCIQTLLIQLQTNQKKASFSITLDRKTSHQDKHQLQIKIAKSKSIISQRRCFFFFNSNNTQRFLAKKVIKIF